MKKLIALLLVLALSFSMLLMLTACDGQTDPDEEEEEEEEKEEEDTLDMRVSSMTYTFHLSGMTGSISFDFSYEENGKKAVSTATTEGNEDFLSMINMSDATMTISYNSDNRVESLLMEMGQMTTENITEYRDGKTYQLTTINTSPNFTSTVVTLYDENGFITKRTSTSGDQVTVTEHIYEKDDSGKIVTGKIMTDGAQTGREVFTYDGDVLAKKEVYDSQDNLIEKSEYNENGKLVTQYSYLFTNSGSDPQVYLYQYTYDKKDRQIKMEQYLDGQLQQVMETEYRN